MKKKLITAFTYIFLLFFCFIFVNCIFLARKSIIDFDMKISVIISIVFSIISTIVYMIFIKISDLLKNKYAKRIGLGLIFILIFIIQIVIAKSFYYPSGWDVEMITESAKALAMNQGGENGYFQKFPNNVFLLWIFKNIFNISNMFSSIEYNFALVIFNIIMIDLAVFVTILVSNKIFKDKSTIITSIFCITLLLFSPWMVIVYSDTLGLIFPILLFYIYLNIKECKRDISKYLLAVLMGVIALIGFQVKPTNIIVIIAIIISMFLFNITDKKSFLNQGCIIICIIIGFVPSKILYNNTIAHLVVSGVDVSDNYDVEVPVTHFLMMGMQQSYDGERNTYGCWNGDDYGFTYDIAGKKEKIKANMEEVKNRLNNFGVVGYLNFLNNKANWILNDGTFFYGGEGRFVIQEQVPTNDFQKTIQEYYVPTKDGYVKTAYCYQGIWITLLLLLVIPICFKVKHTEEIFILRLTIVGIVMFLLLFEARSRYLINHIPIFILVATYGFKCICDKINISSAKH